MAKIHRSRISNAEWGLVIGALILIDIVQFFLALFAVGIVVNTGIDILVGMAFPFYLHMRGESMADPKRLLGFLAVFGLEFIPLVNGLPFWSLDGAYNFMLAKTRNKKAEEQQAAETSQEKQQKMQIQAERAERLQQIREQQQMQREEERQERRISAQNETEATNLDDEDLYDRAA